MSRLARRCGGRSCPLFQYLQRRNLFHLERADPSNCEILMIQFLRYYEEGARQAY